MNFIVTCPRNFEDEATEEFNKILDNLGDKEAEFTKSNMPGILTVSTKLDQIKVIEKIKEKILDEPWTVRYCLRIIPIQGVCTTDYEKIENEIKKMKKIIPIQDSYRITIENRNSKISSTEIISRVAENISNKVSLENPDWIVLIEILGEKTGVAIIKSNQVLSIQKIKRSLSE